MKTNKLVAVILSGVAAFFSLLAIFMLIPKDVSGNVWSYLDRVFVFLSVGCLLTFAILDFAGITFNKYLYAISLSGIAITFLIDAIQDIVDMTEPYSYGYYSFTDIFRNLFAIFVLVVFAYGIVKKNVAATVFSLTYLGAGFFFSGLNAFNGMFFSLFKEYLKFLPQFSSFLYYNGLFLFYLTLAFIAYRAHKDEL